MALDFASIGLRIKHARTEKNLTQEKLAEMLGISRIQIAYLENGDRGISLEMLVNVSNILNVPIAELLADSLNSTDKIDDSDLRYILLDCTTQEEKIITKAAKALKAILSEHGV
ncbi:MAG: helix-turn-helix transcriptional regulator [Clostridia bacterium]|nr:helix-turn-helix transcriptional regulator [Clostridia bacterium]